MHSNGAKFRIDQHQQLLFDRQYQAVMSIDNREGQMFVQPQALSLLFSFSCHSALWSNNQCLHSIIVNEINSHLSVLSISSVLPIARFTEHNNGLTWIITVLSIRTWTNVASDWTWTKKDHLRCATDEATRPIQLCDFICEAPNDTTQSTSLKNNSEMAFPLKQTIFRELQRVHTTHYKVQIIGSFICCESNKMPQ